MALHEPGSILDPTQSRPTTPHNDLGETMLRRLSRPQQLDEVYHAAIGTDIRRINTENHSIPTLLNTGSGALRATRHIEPSFGGKAYRIGILATGGRLARNTAATGAAATLACPTKTSAAVCRRGSRSGAEKTHH